MIAKRLARACCFGLLGAIMSFPCCYGGDVVLIRTSTAVSSQERYVELSSEYYGLRLEKVTVDVAKTDNASLTSVLQQKSTLAAIIMAEALPALDRNKMLLALRRDSANSIPLLILGVTKDTDPRVLKIWSDGAVIGVNPLDTSIPTRSYVVGHVEGFTRQLSDAKIAFQGVKACSLVPAQAANLDQVASLRDGARDQPVFVRASVGQSKMFVACELSGQSNPLAGWYPQEAVEAIPEVAPALMFVRYAGGELAWHVARHYANLTIDDAWLREPYGHLEYKGLLEEMNKHRFHSTVAFIPWNYDRSDPSVVSLIRSHPESYSICVHGNNHDHQEFTDYHNKPLAVQVRALRQSLARMDKFQELTGIPYDKVMVFPHSIAPAMTLAALKEYNYEATANSVNIPMDQATPSDHSFFQRPVTLGYGNFPSITRYSVEGSLPDGFIALQEFLDNPLLFYCHQKFFEKGIDAFDKTADEVNRLEPNTLWTGLGEIASHLYLLRMREDSNYDVMASSGSISLNNASGRDLIYYVKKPESGRPAIMSITIDSQPLPYQLHDGYLNLKIAMSPGSSHHISIEYKNDSAEAPIDITKDSFAVSLLRAASDFRDIGLSRFSVGQWAVRFYYNHDLTPTEVVVSALLLVLSLILGMRGLRRVVRGSERAHVAG